MMAGEKGGKCWGTTSWDREGEGRARPERFL